MYFTVATINNSKCFHCTDMINVWCDAYSNYSYFLIAWHLAISHCTSQIYAITKCQLKKWDNTKMQCTKSLQLYAEWAESRQNLGFLNSEIFLCGIVILNIWHYTFIKIQNSVEYKEWFLMQTIDLVNSQHIFICYVKCITLMQDVINRDYSWMGSMWKSTSSAQYCNYKWHKIKFTDWN